MSTGSSHRAPEKGLWPPCCKVGGRIDHCVKHSSTFASSNNRPSAKSHQRRGPLLAGFAERKAHWQAVDDRSTRWTVFAAGTVAGPYLGTTCARPIWLPLHGAKDPIVPFHGGQPPGSAYLGVAKDWCLCTFPNSAVEQRRFSPMTIQVDLVARVATPGLRPVTAHGTLTATQPSGSSSPAITFNPRQRPPGRRCSSKKLISNGDRRGNPRTWPTVVLPSCCPQSARSNVRSPMTSGGSRVTLPRRHDESR